MNVYAVFDNQEYPMPLVKLFAKESDAKVFVEESSINRYEIEEWEVIQ